MPALNRVRKQARAVACQMNLHQWAIVFSMYTDQNNGYFLSGLAEGVSNVGKYWWMEPLKPYYTDERIRIYQEKSEHQARQRKQGTEIRDGKLYTDQNNALDASVVQVLKNVSSGLKPKFDREAYQKFKKDYNENGLEDQTNENS